MKSYVSLAALGLAAAPANAFFLMPCWPVSEQRVDPIVNPGEVAPHVHQIAGGNGFAPVMNYSETQESSCTTCFVKGDKSNYWIPSMYYKHQDGSFEKVDQVGSASMYYFNEASRLGPGEKMEPFPKGLRMLAGDPEKRSGGTDAASQALNYKCLDYSGTPTDSKTFPTGNCADGVRAEVTYPSCWDGQNLDSDDHKSHMAYPTTNFENGACPSTHPHHLVTLKVEFIFDTNKYKDQWYGDSQPFVWSNGDPTGYGLHADYVMGWDYELLSSAVEQCFDEFGVIANCAPFAGQLQEAYVNPDTCSVKSFVDEDISGPMPALPGCNTLQYGPGAATKENCQDGAKLMGAWANAQNDGLFGSGIPLSLGWGAGSSESAAATSYSAPAYSAPSYSAPAAPGAPGNSFSVKPHGFYTQANVAAVSSASPAPVPSPSQAGVKIVTVTDIITETTYTTESSQPSAAPAASTASKAWGSWKREIGDDVHKHHLRHIRRGGRRN